MPCAPKPCAPKHCGPKPCGPDPQCRSRPAGCCWHGAAPARKSRPLPEDRLRPPPDAPWCRTRCGSDPSCPAAVRPYPARIPGPAPLTQEPRCASGGYRPVRHAAQPRTEIDRTAGVFLLEAAAIRRSEREIDHNNSAGIGLGRYGRSGGEGIAAIVRADSGGSVGGGNVGHQTNSCMAVADGAAFGSPWWQTAASAMLCTAWFAVALSGRISAAIPRRANRPSVSVRDARRGAGLKRARLPMTNPSETLRLMESALRGVSGVGSHDPARLGAPEIRRPYPARTRRSHT